MQSDISPYWRHQARYSFNEAAALVCHVEPTAAGSLELATAKQVKHWRKLLHNAAVDGKLKAELHWIRKPEQWATDLADKPVHIRDAIKELDYAASTIARDDFRAWCDTYGLALPIFDDAAGEAQDGDAPQAWRAWLDSAPGSLPPDLRALLLVYAEVWPDYSEQDAGQGIFPSKDDGKRRLQAKGIQGTEKLKYAEAIMRPEWAPYERRRRSER